MNSLKFRPIILIILDGWGIAPPSFGNAITSSHLPCFNYLLSNFPSTSISASGTAVGLPNNDPGNTEVGHLNIGAGRIVESSVLAIDDAIKEGSFFTNSAFKEAVAHVNTFNSSLHLMGLLSSARVHASKDHLLSLIKFTKQNNVKKLFLHIFTDGRDAPPYEALTQILEVENYLQKLDIGTIASLCGRFWAMDRDRRWDRTQKAYDVLTRGMGENFSLPTVALENFYREGIRDEFIPPIVITKNGAPHTIQKNDAIIFFNHRGERAAQLTQKIISPDNKSLNLFFVSLTRYDDMPVNVIAFPPTKIKNALGEVFSNAGLKQLRLTESEKGRFVTYYLNGNEEQKFPGEERIIIPSSQVKTYDTLPQMSANEITKTLIEKLSSFDLIVVNFANADMVGHTGLFKSTVIACETINNCLQQIVDVLLKTNGILFITGDHGNAEEKIDLKTGLTLNEHTRNPVPLIIVGNTVKNIKLKDDGVLADIAPTILKLTNLEIPPEMTGKVLIEE